MQKPTWNTHRYDVDRVEQMRKAVAAANALFRRPQPRANHQRRQPRHEPILDADAQRPHNAMDDTHLMPVALPVPAIDPVPESAINDTHLTLVALPTPAVDHESHIAVNDTRTMLVALPMPAVDPESQIAVNDTQTRTRCQVIHTCQRLKPSSNARLSNKHQVRVVHGIVWSLRVGIQDRLVARLASLVICSWLRSSE
ncbi:hypothetical protein AC1031_018643 [Aphanomyces cochlioides]|nr:hypothetical protein AC1031_018643 [Aphanomyces cochlioides]